MKAEERERLIGCKVPVLAASLYVVFFGIILKAAYVNGWLISQNAITESNVLNDFFVNIVVMFPIPTILLITYRKKLECIGICRSKLAVILLGVYVLFFVLHGRWDVRGIYRFIFVLFFVAVPEELIYRGYLYLQLKKWNKIGAVIISGIFWGMMHAILPGIVNDKSLSQIMVSMLNEASGGIVSGGMFIIYYELSGSLLVPIMIHALLDYSYKAYGVWIAVVVMIMLAVKWKKNRNTN